MNERGTARVASSGSFWADPESASLVRIAVQADGIPPYLDVRSAETDIRYGDVRLDVRPAVARPSIPPNRSSLPGVPDVSMPALGPAELTLPPGLTVKAKLTTAIDSGHAQVGDEIRAALDAGVRRKNDLILPKGAELTGRIRRLERYSAPNPHFIFALEFTNVLFTRDARQIDARFTGRLESSFGPSNHIGMDHRQPYFKVRRAVPALLKCSRSNAVFFCFLAG